MEKICGINRNKYHQNIKANQMAPANLNITDKLGTTGTIISDDSTVVLNNPASLFGTDIYAKNYNANDVSLNCTFSTN